MAQGDAGGGERIGVAFVDVEARLDKLKTDLREVEKQTDDSMRRVRESGEGAATSVEEVGSRARLTLSDLVSLVTIAFQFRTAWRLATSTFVAALRTLTPRVILFTGVVGVLDLAIRGVRGSIDIAREAMSRFAEAGSADVEVARRAVREISDEFQRIPLIGRMVGGAFQTGMGFARRELDMFRDGLAEATRSVPILGRMLDSLTDNFVGAREAINRAAESMAEVQRQAALMEEVERRTEAMRDASIEREIELRNQLAMHGLEGIEQLHEAERQRHEAVMRNARRERDAMRDQRREMLQPFEEAIRAGGLAELPRAQMEAIEQAVAAAEARFGRALPTGDEESLRETMAFIERRFDDEERLLEERFGNIEQMSLDLIREREQAKREAIATEERRNQRHIEGLQMELAQRQLELEGETFAAREVSIRRNYAERIHRAIEDGEHERANLLHAIMGERIAQLRQQEEQEAEERIASARQEGKRVQDEMREIEQDITRARIAARDDQQLLEAFDIGREFDNRIRSVRERMGELREEIDAIRDAGPGAGERERLLLLQQQLEMLEMQEDRLGVLRRLRMENIDMDGGGASQMTRSLAREVGRDRIARGEGATGPQEVESKQLETVIAELEELNRNRGQGWG